MTEPLLFQERFASGSHVLLLGVDNPLAPGRPGCALLPLPPGSTGFRLWRMIGASYADMVDGVGEFSRADYLRSFWRANVLDVVPPRWTRISTACGERGITHIVVFGREATLALGVVLKSGIPAARAELCCWHDTESSIIKMMFVPHPSGRNRVYNDLAMRKRIGNVLACLALERRALASPLQETDTDD